MQTLKNKSFRASIQWNVLVRNPLALARGGSSVPLGFVSLVVF